MRKYKFTIFFKNGNKKLYYGFTFMDIVRTKHLKVSTIDLWKRGDFINSNKYIYHKDKETWTSNLFYNH